MTEELKKTVWLFAGFGIYTGINLIVQLIRGTHHLDQFLGLYIFDGILILIAVFFFLSKNRSNPKSNITIGAIYIRSDSDGKI